MGFSTSNFPIIVNRIFATPPGSAYWFARYQSVNDWVLQLGYKVGGQVESTSEFSGYNTFLEFVQDIADGTRVLPADRITFDDDEPAVPAEILALTAQNIAGLYTTNPSFPGFDLCDKIASVHLARRFLETSNITYLEWQTVLKNQYPAHLNIPDLQTELAANVAAGNITQAQSDETFIFVTT